MSTEPNVTTDEALATPAVLIRRVLAGDSVVIEPCADRSASQKVSSQLRRAGERIGAKVKVHHRKDHRLELRAWPNP